MARKSKKTKSHSPERSARTLERLANVVPHPRYGTAIVPSKRVGDDDVIREPPAWSKDVTFRESAIPADVRKQNFSTMSHLHWYVDTLVGKRELTDGDMLVLASDVAFLWTQGLLRDQQHLRRIRNRALRQVPGGAATRALDALVASLPKR